jgi:hypothetical protein
VFVVVTEEAGKKEICRLAAWGKFIANAGACVAVFFESGDGSLTQK